MTQGELEQIPQPFVELMSELEMRIMKDIIERIKANGFSPASADWEISRLQQLGESEEQIRKWIKEMLEKTDDEVDKIFSDDVYREYYGHDREYQVSSFEQIPLEQNVQLLQVIEASKRQTKDTFKNLTGSTGFAIRDPATGTIMYSPTMKFYQQTLDAAIMDIKSGAFSYNTVLARTINTMTTSGLRWIDYDSGWHNRVDVAARRAVMTGFRQVQGKINEQVAEDLQTDTYEVTYHVGARPTHQPWQGRVWTMQQLRDICGLGTVTGLHGANCYHDYKPFIPGVSVRTYTDEQLDQMMAEENTPKEYLGKKYTTYEALQAQRRMETRMRKTRQDIRLMQDGGADPNDIVLKKAKYQGQMQTYKAFSEAMELPEQMERVYQDGLRGKFTPTKTELTRTNITESESGNIENIRIGNNKVNLAEIGTEAYSRKFNQITKNSAVNDSIRKYARTMLTHRNGSNGEDLYIISAKTGKRLFSKVTGKNELGVELSTDEISQIRQFAKREGIIGMHNHPTNVLPTGSDLVVAGGRKYEFGIVATHDGRVFWYKVGEKPFRSEYFNRIVDKYVSQPYNYDIEKAQKETLIEFGKEFGVEWKELK